MENLRKITLALMLIGTLQFLYIPKALAQSGTLCITVNNSDPDSETVCVTQSSNCIGDIYSLPQICLTWLPGEMDRKCFPGTTWGFSDTCVHYEVTVTNTHTRNYCILLFSWSQIDLRWEGVLEPDSPYGNLDWWAYDNYNGGFAIALY